MAPTPDEQKRALLALEIHAGCGLNWAADVPLASFDGVTVDTSGRVIGLNLRGRLKKSGPGFRLEALGPILTELLTELVLGSAFGSSNDPPVEGEWVLFVGRRRGSTLEPRRSPSGTREISGRSGRCGVDDYDGGNGWAHAGHSTGGVSSTQAHPPFGTIAIVYATPPPPNAYSIRHFRSLMRTRGCASRTYTPVPIACPLLPPPPSTMVRATMSFRRPEGLAVVHSAGHA